LRNVEKIYLRQENYVDQLSILLKLNEAEPGNTDHLLRTARCYHQLMNYGKTEEYCLQVLNSNPEHGEALDLICVIYMKQQNYKAAAVQLEKNLKINPSRIDIYLHLFTAHFNLNALEKAGRYIVQALNLDSQSIEVLQTALYYYKEIGNIPRQTEICNQLLALKPDDYAFKRQMSKLLLEQQMFKEAENLIRDLLAHTPNDPELLIQQAKIYTLQGLPSKAIIQLQQVLSIEPNNAMARFELGRTFHAQKEWNKAVVEFKKAVNLGIQDPRAFGELGEIYAARGFFENAVEVYQKAAELDPENNHYHFQMAEIYFKLNLADKALMEYESLLEKQPSNINLNVRLAQVYSTQRMFEQAETLLTKLLTDHEDNTEILFELGKINLNKQEKEKALETFRKILDIQPGHLKAQVEVAVLESRKNPQEALKTIKKMIEKSPTQEFFFYLSKVYIDNNMIDQAVAEFKILIKTYPNSAPAYAELGKLYTILSKAFNNDAKMRESGLEALNKAVSLDDTYALAYFYMGENYHLIDNLEAALGNLKKAYQLDPQNIEIREFLNAVENQKISIEIARKLEEAKTFLSRGMDQNAIIEYEFILELSPFHDEANYDLATIYMKQNNIEEAKKYFLNSVQKNPDFIQSRFELANIYRQEANLNQAEVELEKILKRQPRDFRANLLMGSLLAEADEYTEAAIYLQKASEINPSDYKPYFEMGKMFEKLEETEQARFFYDKVYKLDSSIHEVNEFFINLEKKQTAEKIANLLQKAREAEDRKDNLQAKNYYEDLLGIQPSHFYARYRSGIINETLGKLSEAAFDYQQAYASYDETKATEYSDLLPRYGMLLSKLGRTQDTIPILIVACRAAPNDEMLALTLIDEYKRLFSVIKMSDFEGLSPDSIVQNFEEKAVKQPKQALNWICVGYCYRINLKNGKDMESGYKKGIDAYLKALEIDPENQHAIYNLGILYHFTGKISKAREALKNLVQIAPEETKAYQRLIHILTEAKEFDEACEYVKKLIEIEPENGGHRMMLIDIYKIICENQQDKEAQFRTYRDKFTAAVQRNPREPMVHFDAGYAAITLNSGLSLEEEDAGYAISEFKQAISLAPDNPWGYWGLKRVYNKESISGKTRYAESIDICRKALEKAPEMAQSFIELGNACNEDYETNRKNEALEQYKKALQLDPELVEAHFKIASISRIRNQQDEAIDAYKRVIEIDPTSHFSKDAKRSLIHIEKSKAENL
jgi:tetratricopeptide (TPR) repeat protein